MSNSLFSRLMFWQKSARKIKLGIFLGADFLSVYVPAVGGQEAKYQTFEFPANDWKSAFATINKHFSTCDVEIVLSSSHYQIILADKPAVPEAEVPQALLWAIKDLVSLPVNNIFLDYFSSPVATIAKINVVVADKTLLTQIALAAEASNISIQGITVEELAVSNLGAADAQARLVVTHLPGQELLLAVVREGELFMQRRIRGFSQLQSSTAEELSLMSADNLSLEIQRSMDYFESQLRQPPVGLIDILVEGEAKSLAELVGVNFNQQVSPVAKTSVAEKMAELAFYELNRGMLDVNP